MKENYFNYWYKRFIKDGLKACKTISDMESDGVYFPEEIKDKLQEYREEMHCEYSGLPSPKAYENVK